MTLDEFSERAGAALRARVGGELALVQEDLPEVSIAVSGPQRKPARALCGTSLLENVGMPSHQRSRSEPGAGQPAAAGLVELVGDPQRPRAWTLLVDGITQSHVDLDDPWHLELEYMRWLGHLIDVAAPAGTPLRVLHLGGGALTLARYVAVTRPGSSQLAVESDAHLMGVTGSVPRRTPAPVRCRSS